jgi:hypothetical protein
VRASADGGDAAVSLALLPLMLILAMLLWLPWLLFRVARRIALRLWFGRPMREIRAIADQLTGAPAREAEWISRGVPPKIARRLARK